MSLFSITVGSNDIPGDWEDIRNVTVRPYAGECEHRCKACDAELMEYPGRKFTAEGNGAWTDDCQENLDDNGNFGPHVPEFIPLSWADSAEIDFDEGADEIKVTVMLNGSPLTLAVHRVTKQGHENYGKFVVMVPYADMHSELSVRKLQSGSYVVNTR